MSHQEGAVVMLPRKGRKPAALTDWVYATLKDAVLSLEFPMGSQLKIEELACRMDCSRTPVREALLRLEKDGLVEVVPRVGFFVTHITRRDLRELLEIRELLEAYAARTAVATLSDSDLNYLDQLLELGEKAVEEDDLEQFQQVEIEFHTRLMDLAPNRRLREAMNGLQDLTYRERMLALRSPGNVRETLREHRQIVEALREGDGELAGRMMAEHIAGVRTRLMDFLELPEDADRGVLD
jgi:DNA-binding GntR family transcriptional regulator